MLSKLESLCINLGATCKNKLIKRDSLALCASLLISAMLGCVLLIYSRTIVLGMVLIGFLSLAIIFIEPFLGLLAFTAVSLFKPTLLNNYPIVFKFHVPLLLGMMTLAAWVLREMHDKRDFFKVLKIPQTWLLLGFIIFAYLSVNVDLSNADHGYYLSDLSKNIILYILIVNLINSERKVKITLWTMIAIISYLAFLGIRKYNSGELADAQPYRFMDKNNFAASIVMVIPITVGFLWNERALYRKAIMVISIAILIMAVLKLNSRGGYLALGVSLLLIILKDIRKFKRLFIFIILATALIMRGPSQAWEHFLSIKDYNEDASSVGRLDAWKTALVMMKEHPLTGVGIGTFVNQYNSYTSKDASIARNVHNIYLLVGAEVGVLGLCMYLLFIGLTFIDVLKFRRAAKNEHHLSGISELITYSGIGLFTFCFAGLFLNFAYRSVLFELVGLIVAMKESLISKQGSHWLSQDLETDVNGGI